VQCFGAKAKNGVPFVGAKSKQRRSHSLSGRDEKTLNSFGRARRRHNSTARQRPKAGPDLRNKLAIERQQPEVCDNLASDEAVELSPSRLEAGS
jgi:hypothetical protein